MDTNLEDNIKKISLENFNIIDSLNRLKDKISDDENKKNLSKIITEIKKNDKNLLNYCQVKFSDNEKKKILKLLKLYI